jgi:hypothetical protein
MGAWRSKKADLQILRKVNRVEFKYKGEFYNYEFRSDSKTGFAFIFAQGGVKIYGPYKTDCTELGEEIYNALLKQIQPKK